MTGENPYAPPQTDEPAVSSARYWRTYGTSLFVRNGTTLPMIDLETGASDDSLLPIQRIHQSTSPGNIIRNVCMVALIIGLKTVFDIQGLNILLIVFAVSFLSRRLTALSGRSSSRVAIWTYTEKRRVTSAKRRRTIRLVAWIAPLILLCIIFISSSADIGNWIFNGYLIWLALTLLLGIWSLLDKPKYKLHTAEPGWLRITPLHSEALKKLHLLEREECPLAAPARKRLVRTVYYHRFPLRMLIGHHTYNPLILWRCVLMKLLRSKLLERDSYHFSEAEEVPMQNLHSHLLDAATAWLTAHPDWVFVTAKHLPSPAGDLILETVILASPRLEHSIHLSRAWLAQHDAKGYVHCTFITWFADGTHTATLDQPFIPIQGPHQSFRAHGSPEQIYQAHMQYIATKVPLPADDLTELRAWIIQNQQQSDQQLTQLGLQSEPREV